MLLQIITSMLLMFIFFFPTLFLNKYFYGLSHKILIFLICSLNILSVGVLYLNQDSYTYFGFTALKEFDFSFESLINVYIPLFIFLPLLLFFIFIINRISKLFNKGNYYLYQKKLLNIKNYISSKINEIPKTKFVNSFYIFVLSTVQIICSLIIFYTGKGMVGVVPDDVLPFKIIGISYFISKLFVPVILIVLFLKSKFSNIIIVYVFLAAIIAGSAHLSRSTFLFSIIVPLLIIFFSKNNYILKFLIFIFFFYGLHNINSARDFVWDYRDVFGMVKITPTIIKDWNILFLETLFKIVTYDFWVSSLNNFFDITYRVANAQEIILGAQFNLDTIGGAFELFKGIIFHKFENIDGDIYTLEWMGEKLPPGFMAGGLILSKITSLWFYEKKLFSACAFYIAIWCKIIDYICIKIKIGEDLGTIFFNFLSTLVLLIWIGSSAFFLYFITLFVIILSLYLLSFFKKKKVS